MNIIISGIIFKNLFLIPITIVISCSIIQLNGTCLYFGSEDFDPLLICIVKFTYAGKKVILCLDAEKGRGGQVASVQWF